MKVFLTVCTIVLATVTAQAQQQIPIIWPFHIGDTQAQYSRSLVEELNKNQKKYTFILENRPGAGASIGARHVAASSNSILATSTAFFVRPNFYPQASYKITDFRPLMTQCAAPMVIVSGRYRTWDAVPQQEPINIGISGLGATSHLMAMEIIKRFSNLEPVPYKGTREASWDVITGNIQLGVAFLGEVEEFIANGKLYALGISGQKTVSGIPTLASQGFNNMEQIVNMHSLQVSQLMSDMQYQELRLIVVQAAQVDSVQRAYSVDNCTPSNLNITETQHWFDEQVAFWQRLSQNVKFDK